MTNKTIISGVIWGGKGTQAENKIRAREDLAARMAVRQMAALREGRAA